MSSHSAFSDPARPEEFPQIVRFRILLGRDANLVTSIFFPAIYTPQLSTL